MGRPRTWTDEELRAAVAASESISEVLRRLGLAKGGGTLAGVRKRMLQLGLDTSHFTGQGWNKGGRVPNGLPIPLEEILVEKSTYRSSHNLRLRLIAEGYKTACCEACGLSKWRGRRIPLQLDHSNGDRTDNRLVNLRLLCPNCHAQTGTWCGKNKGRYSSSAAPLRPAPVHEIGIQLRLKSGGPQGRGGSSPPRGTDHGRQLPLF